MKSLPWDQIIARRLIQYIKRTPITPNQLTIFTLFLALGGSILLTLENSTYANWGVGLFVLARFLDHFDGELARQKGMTSKFGYYFDYTSGAISYCALFICLGIRFYHTELGIWSIVLGASGAISAIISMFTNLSLDKNLQTEDEKDAVGYPSFGGFELEDGIYLIAPITWFGYLMPFFVAAGIGAIIYCLWTIKCLIIIR
jgi:phosphatidylglycerophosphate synthase